MPPRASWSRLLPGIIVLAVIGLTAAGILAFGGVGRIRGETIQLYVVTNQARGVMRGTEVWVAGQRVGKVKDIRFLTASNDTAGRVLLVVDVRERDAEQIRRDSKAEIRRGFTVIGPSVVHVGVGSPRSLAVRAGDTIYATQSDPESRTAKLKLATAQIGPAMADARSAIALVRDPNGSLGAILKGNLRSDFAVLRRRASRVFHHRSTHDNGVGFSTVAASARAMLARVDSIRALLASKDNSLGRFRRDSSFGTTVDSVRRALAHLRQALVAEDGTTGRLAADSALPRSLADAQREMALLSDDIRRRPLRYLHLF